MLQNTYELLRVALNPQIVDDHMPDDPFLVNDEGCPGGDSFFLDQHTVQPGHAPMHIGQQRERDPQVLGKGFVGRSAINAYTQNLGI